MDICDYLNGNIIGAGTTESDCTTWGDIYLYANNSKNAFIQALKQFINAATPCTSGETCGEVYQEKIYQDFWEGCFIDYHKKFQVFFNMMQCSPQTGVQNESINLPTSGGTMVSYNYTVDYGDGIFDLTIAEEYQTMEAEFMCCIKNIMVLIMGETFEGTSYVNFNYIT